MTTTNDTKVTVFADDGTELGLYVSRPLGAARGAILVLQEIFGVNEHIRDVTRRFAAQGYLAVAPDLFHRSGAWFEGAYGDMLPGVTRAQALTQDQIRCDLRASHAFIVKDTPAARIAAIGFCMGGRQAYVANGILPLACAVSFYGSNIAALPELAATQGGPMMLLWGGKDGHILPAHRRAAADMLADAKKHYVDVTFGDAEHGFFCDARSAYDEASAMEAWALVTTFLRRHLG